MLVLCDQYFFYFSPLLILHLLDMGARILGINRFYFAKAEFKSEKLLKLRILSLHIHQLNTYPGNKKYENHQRSDEPISFY